METIVRMRVGVLTSGGNAQGMDAAVHATVRGTIQTGAEVSATQEGRQGVVMGGDYIKQMGRNNVSGALNKGDTVIGTARCPELRDREGRRAAVGDLVTSGVDRLIVVGGSGPLTGTCQLRLEWSELSAELVNSGEVGSGLTERHSVLQIAGPAGLIDNDMVGTDMTIGTDSVLYRITEATDAIFATAESHQRTFTIEVMGYNCGYPALISAITGDADYIFLPEPPPRDSWEDRIVDILGRDERAGRRDLILVVVESAVNRQGEPITANHIRDIPKGKGGEDARITILGHVQRGGKPSAYDRWAATTCSVEAVSEIPEASAEAESVLAGVHSDRIGTRPLLASTVTTRRIADYTAGGDYEVVISLCDPGFQMMIDTYRAITEARPSMADPAGERIAIMHAGVLIPGMNQLARVVARSGIGLGYQMLAVRGRTSGLVEDDFNGVS